MSRAPHIVYALEAIPISFSAAVFLAGPVESAAPDAAPASWQAAALAYLTQRGYDGLVFWPTPRPGGHEGPVDADRVHLWTHEALHHADAILVWHPDAAPDPATLDLWGAWQRSGKIILGIPRGALRPQRLSASQLRVPVAHSLEEAIDLMLPMLVPGAQRAGGERAVPLLLWRSPAFQRWYRALRTAGNDLDDVEVEWTYRPRAGPGRPPLIFAIRPRVWVRRERRHKAGEVVVGRAEVSATVLYHPAAQQKDMRLVLVREFRSAGTGPGGFVLELPGGSAEYAADRDQDPRMTALREVEQETGLRLDPRQLEPVPLGARQIAATILSHRAHLYRAELTDAQMLVMEETERTGTAHGANAGERCYVVVRTLGQLLSGAELDWSQLGMVLFACGSR